MSDSAVPILPIIPKPWGFEYELLVSAEVRLLHLQIGSRQKTSLHCHPEKKTAMLFLRGQGVVHFLNSSQSFAPGHRLILRPSLFHQIEANDQEVEVLEIESPPNKDDLVRLEDHHGREGLSYEDTVYQTKPTTVWDFDLTRPQIGGLGRSVSSRYEVYDFFLSSSGPGAAEELQRVSVCIVLSGYLKTRDGRQILGPSDIVPPATLTRLAGKFRLTGSLRLLAFGIDSLKG